MAPKFIRCPLCYGRLATAEGADAAFDLEMHRLSGHCRAYVPPKGRTPRKTDNSLNRLDDWMGGDY